MLKKSTAALTALLCPLSLCSCVSGTKYDNADKYTASESGAFPANQINAIHISWIAGSVTVEPGDSENIEFFETSSSTTNDDTKLHYWKNGTTLMLQYSKSKSIRRMKLTKKLTVRIPHDYMLELLKIHTVSADISAYNLQASDLLVHSTSGNIQLSNAAVTNKISVNSTSGAIKADASASTAAEFNTTSGNMLMRDLQIKGSLNAESTSGEISLDNVKSQALSVATTSGSIDALIDSAESFNISSVSGKISVKSETVPQKATAQTTSGAIALYLPQNTEFTARTSTISGKFNTEFNCSIQNGSYVCGNGACKLELETVSGNISVNKLNK